MKNKAAIWVASEIPDTTQPFSSTSPLKMLFGIPGDYQVRLLVALISKKRNKFKACHLHNKALKFHFEHF